MRCGYCKVSQKKNALVLSLRMAGPGMIASPCGACCSHFCAVLRRRLPGGYKFRDIRPYSWEYRHGLRVSALRLLHVISSYCLGGRLATGKGAIGELRPPYPPLYHFTPEANRDAILAHGLVSGKKKVYLTNWRDRRWAAYFREYKRCDTLICFQIDAERLIAAGHPISVINRFHEYCTDHVPPDCLTLTNLRLNGTVGDQ